MSKQQAGFGKGFSSRNHLQTVKTLIEKCNEYNITLLIAFVYSGKAFSSIDLIGVGYE